MRIRNMLADFQGRFMEWETGAKPDGGALNGPRNGPPNGHHMELQMNDFNALLALVTVLISILALVFSLYSFTFSRRKKRRKLINAIYYHACQTIKSLEEYKKGKEKIRQTIENDESYTPYVVPVSPADELAYDQVIDALEWLQRKDEEAMLAYFHSQSNLHSLAQSFDSEFVRGWSRGRKLAMWDSLEQRARETLEHANATKQLLEDKRSPR